jgi:hypothetical protein
MGKLPYPKHPLADGKKIIDIAVGQLKEDVNFATGNQGQGVAFLTREGFVFVNLHRLREVNTRFSLQGSGLVPDSPVLYETVLYDEAVSLRFPYSYITVVKKRRTFLQWLPFFSKARLLIIKTKRRTYHLKIGKFATENFYVVLKQNQGKPSSRFFPRDCIFLAMRIYEREWMMMPWVWR